MENVRKGKEEKNHPKQRSSVSSVLHSCGRLPGKGEKKWPSLVSPQEPKALYQGDARAGLPGSLKQGPKGSNLAGDVGHRREQRTRAAHPAKLGSWSEGQGRGLPSPQHLAQSLACTPQNAGGLSTRVCLAGGLRRLLAWAPSLGATGEPGGPSTPPASAWPSGLSPFLAGTSPGSDT